MKVVNGYYEDGRFTPFDTRPLPRRVKAVLVYDESSSAAEDAPPLTDHAKAWLKFIHEIRICDEQLGAEFDEAMSQRVNFARELDL